MVPNTKPENNLVLLAIDLKHRDISFPINLISRRMSPNTLGLHDDDTSNQKKAHME